MNGDTAKAAGPAPKDRGSVGVTVFNIVISLGLMFLLGMAAFVFDSRLALAQAADSLTDVLTAAAFLWSVHVSRRPADEDHPFGHHGAEPVVALVVAVLTGGLAVEVLRSAIVTIVSGGQPDLDWLLAGVFTLKIVLKILVIQMAKRRTRSPAMQAMAVDARNDVAVGALAIVGYLLAKYGWSGFDAWLAIPVAIWVARTGVTLGLANIRLLMGEAPPTARQNELIEIARTLPGVLNAHSLRARYHGPDIELWVQVAVDPQISVREAHDIGEAVERRLEVEEDVADAVVHVDIE